MKSLRNANRPKNRKLCANPKKLRRAMNRFQRGTEVESDLRALGFAKHNGFRVMAKGDCG